jgi:hypothetical protein
MIEERPIREIESDVRNARISKVKLNWQPDELAIDMFVVTRQLVVDLEKYLNQGMKAPARRIRATTKILETLGKSFRVQSVKVT